MTTIKLITVKRISPRKEEVNVLINGIEYFGYTRTLGENWNKKYVIFLRKPEGKNQAKWSVKMELENYINNIWKPIAYPCNYKGKYEMNKYKHLIFQVTELREQTRANWDVRYREDFIASNMFKLNRALAKHLTNDMTSSNINVNIGGDGAEVTAIVDNMSFRTFGTLCGGNVQVYHYRYRSSLK